MKKKNTKRFIVFSLVPIFVIGVIFASFFGYRTWMQNSIENLQKITAVNGIDTFEKIEIGGDKQWIWIRGNDKNNPILLFLHGGPGQGMSAFTHTFQDPWEDHFTVVHWDQRGTGKSYDKDILPSSMTLDQMNADTVEVVQYLRERFDREKIFIPR